MASWKPLLQNLAPRGKESHVSNVETFVVGFQAGRSNPGPCVSTPGESDQVQFWCVANTTTRADLSRTGKARYDVRDRIARQSTSVVPGEQPRRERKRR